MTDDTALTNYKKMLKFIRGKGSGIQSLERAKLQKDLYAFRKLNKLGFPSKPTAFAYDPTLKLISVGNKSGFVTVFGRPGVEFAGQHPNDEAAIIKIVFVPKHGHIITVTEDNSLHLWKIRTGNGASLTLLKSCSLEGKIKKISCLRVKEGQNEAFIGTEGGNVYSLDIGKFELTEQVIYLDVILQNAPENFKVKPGAVEALIEIRDELIIGFERGLITKWSHKENKSVKNFVQNQQLEFLTLNEGGEMISSHNDGSYIVWNWEKEGQEKPKTVYGPYPCKKISKIRAVGDLIAFSGGLPRASDGDHHSVSVITPDKHVVFDLTSKVIDFEITENAEALLILAEEELVAVDLTLEDWPVFRNPYLNSIHPSAVTCFHHTPLTQKLNLTGGTDETIYSSSSWPVKGGECSDTDESIELLITGHEDGSVRFWESQGSRMALLAKYSFGSLFRNEDDDMGEHPPDDDEEWPPYRKVGTFDPYSDDPRLAVKKLAYCPISGYLAIGGTAGQLIVVNTKVKEQDGGKVDNVNLVAENFVWKGHEALKYNKFQGVTGALQIHPPASATALALEGQAGLVAVGTGHGLVLYDFIGKRILFSKSTLNPSDVMASGDVGMSRRKSFKKSLRESFRRLRKGRSQRNIDRSPAANASGVPGSNKTVERAIEARSNDDAMSSMVRCLCFARTHIISFQQTTPTLWVGTNAGTVFVLCIQMSESRAEINCLLGKEIQLKHRAPVLSIIIVDSQSAAVDSFHPSTSPGPHRVLIGSEEQIKVFTLPNLRPMGKLKLTAQEGARVRRLGVSAFQSITDSYTEKCICCLTNQGDLYVITLPDLKRQLSTNCLRKEDISGISSLVFTPEGHAIFMCSSSELQRVTLSARYDLPFCSVPGIEGDTNSVDKNDFSLKAESLDVSGDITLDAVTDHLTNGTSREQSTETETLADPPEQVNCTSVEPATPIEALDELRITNGHEIESTTTSANENSTSTSAAAASTEANAILRESSI